MSYEQQNEMSDVISDEAFAEHLRRYNVRPKTDAQIEQEEKAYGDFKNTERGKQLRERLLSLQQFRWYDVYCLFVDNEDAGWVFTHTTSQEFAEEIHKRAFRISFLDKLEGLLIRLESVEAYLEQTKEAFYWSIECKCEVSSSP